MKRLNRFFETKTAYGVLFLRIIMGWRLIAGAWDYAIISKPISEVSGFFTQLHIPLPTLSAWLSVYSQFICGILFIIGLWVRPAAMVMIVNFSIAIIAAHTADPIEKSFAAWTLLASSLFLLCYGAGRVAIDHQLEKKTSLVN